MRHTVAPNGSMNTSLRVACAAATLAAGLAHADTITPVQNGGPLPLSQSFASTAPNQTPTTVTGTGANDGSGSILGSDLTGNGGSTYLFDNSYSNSVGSYTAATLNNGNTLGFVSSYVVALPVSISSSYVFSLNLSSNTGIDDLSARLYQYGPGENTTLGITGQPPQGGVLQPWSASSNGMLVDSTTVAPQNIPAGLYVLELVGQLSPGATSGSYSGQLAVTPVPLPAAFPLMFGGILGLAGFARRRGGATRRIARA